MTNNANFVHTIRLLRHFTKLVAISTITALFPSMNTKEMRVLSTVRPSDDHLIPLRPGSLPTLAQRIAISHAVIVAKWDVNFALNLRRPVQSPYARTSSVSAPAP